MPGAADIVMPGWPVVPASPPAASVAHELLRIAGIAAFCPTHSGRPSQLLITSLSPFTLRPVFLIIMHSTCLFNTQT